MNNLTQTVQDIVSRSSGLKNTFTDEVTAPVEFGCIFCQTEEEYDDFTNTIKSLGKIVEDTESGFTYFLDDPISTVSGPLRFVKIRKPDPLRPEKGDADFNIDYEKFSKKYQDNPKFELVERETFKYLRLSDPNFDVLTCFSNLPKSQVLGITL